MNNHRLTGAMLVLAAFAFLPISPASAESAAEQALQVFVDRGAPAEVRSLRDFNDLRNKVTGEAQFSVIVRFDERAGAAGDQSSERAIGLARAKVLEHLERHAQGKFSVKREFSTMPLVSLYLKPAALDALLRAPGVVQIQENSVDRVLLDNTVDIVEGDMLHSVGLTGAGQTVAILDTGVANDHPFTSNIVHEQCFSTNNNSFASLCPDGTEQQGGAGSSEPCNVNSSCYHGTHVAGIAAGKASGVSFTGVAKEASIIDINVFSRRLSDNRVLTYADDQIAALEHVYTLRNDYNIAAVNMSLGGGKYTSHCNSDVRKVAIDRLRNVGISVVVSSGNNGYKDAISAPACISTAIAVGNTTDSDNVNSSSNSATTLDVLAPGTHVMSSYLTSTLSPIYQSLTGTSMAAPHVAGGIALIRQAHPSWSASTIENYLATNGPIIYDINSIGKRRLDLKNALKPGQPGIHTEYSGCQGYGTNYVLAWFLDDYLPVLEWDVDVAYNYSSTWYAFYNGTSNGTMTTVHQPTRYRVRARNAHGWGPFAYSNWLPNYCSNGGGPIIP